MSFIDSVKEWWRIVKFECCVKVENLKFRLISISDGGKQWWQFWKHSMNKDFGSDTQRLLRSMRSFMKRLKTKSEESLSKELHMNMTGYQGQHLVIRGSKSCMIQMVQEIVEYWQQEGFHRWRTLGDYHRLMIQGIDAGLSSITCYIYKTSSGFASFGNAVSEAKGVGSH